MNSTLHHFDHRLWFVAVFWGYPIHLSQTYFVRAIDDPGVSADTQDATGRWIPAQRRVAFPADKPIRTIHVRRPRSRLETPVLSPQPYRWLRSRPSRRPRQTTDLPLTTPLRSVRPRASLRYQRSIPQSRPCGRCLKTSATTRHARTVTG
jgi:hypothetical protein